MDEPFSNLDTRLRELRDQVLHLKQMNYNIIVTHDADEAMFMCYIALLNKGELQQFGAPIDVYATKK